MYRHQKHWCALLVMNMDCSVLSKANKQKQRWHGSWRMVSCLPFLPGALDEWHLLSSIQYKWAMNNLNSTSKHAEWKPQNELEWASATVSPLVLVSITTGLCFPCVSRSPVLWKSATHWGLVFDSWQPHCSGPCGLTAQDHEASPTACGHLLCLLPWTWCVHVLQASINWSEQPVLHAAWGSTALELCVAARSPC